MKYSYQILNSLIKININKLGNDLNISIYGGSTPHIGSISWALPYLKDGLKKATLSNVSLVSHYDYQLSNKVALKLSQELQVVVCCVCGIHFDHISALELQKIDSIINEFINKYIEEC